MTDKDRRTKRQSKLLLFEIPKRNKKMKKDSKKGLTNGGRFGNIVKRLAGDRERGAS